MKRLVAAIAKRPRLERALDQAVPPILVAVIVTDGTLIVLEQAEAILMLIPMLAAAMTIGWYLGRRTGLDRAFTVIGRAPARVRVEQNEDGEAAAFVTSLGGDLVSVIRIPPELDEPQEIAAFVMRELGFEEVTGEEEE